MLAIWQNGDGDETGPATGPGQAGRERARTPTYSVGLEVIRNATTPTAAAIR